MGRDFQQHGLCLLGIRCQRDLERQGQDAGSTAQRRVLDAGRDELGVRDDHGRAIAQADVGGADADAFDVTARAGDFDHIADANGAFHHQDYTGDEVLHDGLQAETDTDRECADHPGQVLDRDPAMDRMPRPTRIQAQ